MWITPRSPMPEFDDSAWPVDTHTIGFGTDFQYVPISPASKSIYLRYKFNLNNPENILMVKKFSGSISPVQ